MGDKRGEGLRDLVIRMAGGATKDDVKKAARDGFNEALEMTGDDEPPVYTADGKPLGLGYRQTGTTPRDLSAISQERAAAASYRVWNTNPLAKAITEIIVDYVLGPGAAFQYSNEEVQEAVEKFWEDPVNDFEGEGAEVMTRELGIFGEQLWLAFVRDGEDLGMVADGRLRLGPIDPTQIASVITHPQNRRDILAIRLKDENGALDTGPIYKVIRAEETDGIQEGRRDYKNYADLVRRLSEFQEEGHPARLTESLIRKKGVDRRLKEGKEWRFVEQGLGTGPAQPASYKSVDELLKNVEFDGECFYFRVNSISTGLRGRPDLLPMIDWLDRYDQLFFDSAEHVALLKTFVWDLLVEDGSEAAPEPEQNLRYQSAKIRGAKPNSVYAHNQNTTLEAKNPELRTPDVQVILRALRIFIAGGMRIPEHWIAEGGYTNRATAKEMGQPTFRMLTRRQAYVKRMFTQIIQYQIDILVQLGLLDEEVTALDEEGNVLEDSEKIKARDAFELQLPDINVSDTASASEALDHVASAVMKLYTTNLLPLKPALQLVAAMAEILGVKIDVDKGIEALQQNAGDNAALKDLAKALDAATKLDRDNGRQAELDEEAEAEAEAAA